MDTTIFGLGILTYSILRSGRISSTNNTIAAYHPSTIILGKELACYVTNCNGVLFEGYDILQLCHDCKSELLSLLAPNPEAYSLDS